MAATAIVIAFSMPILEYDERLKERRAASFEPLINFVALFLSTIELTVESVVPILPYKIPPPKKIPICRRV